MTIAAKHGTLTPTAIPIMAVLSAHLSLSETRTVVLLQSQTEINYTKFIYYKPFAVDNDMRTCQER